MVTFSDIEDAFNFVSSAGYGIHTAVLSLDSGRIYWRSEMGDLDEIADEESSEGEFIEIPHKNELGLGEELVFQFVDDQLPEEHDQVVRFFRTRGAYSRYRSLLESKGLLQQWYDFQAEREEKALRDWCKANEIPPYESGT